MPTCCRRVSGSCSATGSTLPSVPGRDGIEAVEHVVTFGLEHRTLGPIEALGVDEIQYSKGHQYPTLVDQIDLGVTRLLWVGKERTIEFLQGFFTMLGEELTSKIVFVCSDMWEPYWKVIREKCSAAPHILDRFHIIAKRNKALDEVRAGESRRMASEGQTPLLKKSRWPLLKREENLKTESASACATCSGIT
jgi:transposase